MIEMPKVVLEKCNGCGLCLDVCNAQALTLVNNAITVKETENCDWCTMCEVVCPTGAITCPFEIIPEKR